MNVSKWAKCSLEFYYLFKQSCFFLVDKVHVSKQILSSYLTIMHTIFICFIFYFSTQYLESMEMLYLLNNKKDPEKINLLL